MGNDEIDDVVAGVKSSGPKKPEPQADQLVPLCRILERRREAHGDGVVVVDCGANIGVHTLTFARHMTGWGSVLAIEAQERIFYALTGNISLNNHFNARAIWAAVSDTNGTIEIPRVDYLRPSSFGSVELMPSRHREQIGQPLDYTSGQGVPVTMLTLDSLDLQRLDLLKIDVEGMEEKVFRGAARTIAKHKPVIFVEHIKSDHEAIIRYLRDAGYRLLVLGRNTLALHDDDPVSKEVAVAPSA